jgi:hypothetical protein
MQSAIVWMRVVEISLPVRNPEFSALLYFLLLFLIGSTRWLDLLCAALARSLQLCAALARSLQLCA